MHMGNKPRELAREFDYEGLTDLYDSLCGDADRYTYFSEISGRFDTDHLELMRMLYLGNVISADKTWEAKHERLLSLLEKCGLLHKSKGGISLGGLALYRYRGIGFLPMRHKFLLFSIMDWTLLAWHRGWGQFLVVRLWTYVQGLEFKL